LSLRSKRSENRDQIEKRSKREKGKPKPLLCVKRAAKLRNSGVRTKELVFGNFEGIARIDLDDDRAIFVDHDPAMAVARCRSLRIDHAAFGVDLFQLAPNLLVPLGLCSQLIDDL